MVTQLPDKDEVHMTFQQMLARLDVCMGGRVAEEVATQPMQYPLFSPHPPLAGRVRVQFHHLWRVVRP